LLLVAFGGDQGPAEMAGLWFFLEHHRTDFAVYGLSS